MDQARGVFDKMYSGYQDRMNTIVRKKKILIFVHSFELGGTQVNLLNTIKNLNKTFDFFLVTFQATGSILEREVRRHVKLFSVLHEKIFILRPAPRVIKKIQRLISNIQPALIETHMFYIDNPVREAARRSLLRNVVVYQHGFGSGWNETERRIEQQYIPHTKKYICVTRWNKDILTSVGVPKNKLVVLYNGIDRSRFRNLEPKYDGRLFHVGFIGRLENSKNPLLLPSILEDIVKTYGIQNVLIHVAGNGSLAHALKTRLKQKRLQRFVRFEGEVSRTSMMLLYRQLHLVLFTSKNDSLPTAAIESAVIGLPIIAPDIAGFSELIIHAKTGWLVKKQGEYAQTLSRLILKPKIYSRIVGNVRAHRQHYAHQFSQQKYLSQRERIWRQILQ